MRIEQLILEPAGWRSFGPSSAVRGPFDLVLVFGTTELIEGAAVHATLAERYPEAHVVLCSSAGEIAGAGVYDDSVVATAVGFDHTTLSVAETTLPGPEASEAAGRFLASALPHDGLRHVLVFSDGLDVNGSALTAGLSAGFPASVTVTGGLAGDGRQIARTVVGLDARPTSRRVVVVGLYGAALRIGCGSLGGWDPFGPDRIVTRARDNVVYTLDGRPALDLYKAYLGEHAAGLPASGLLFPLSVQIDADTHVVRTLLSVDEAAGSIAFAGDVPEGAVARLMKANVDRLVDGAVGAAEASLAGGRPELALLISCVGRKLVLQQRVEEEVEAARDVLGHGVVLAGFYSNGEVSPFTPGARCELHNQTMTITTLSEEAP